MPRGIGVELLQWKDHFRLSTHNHRARILNHDLPVIDSSVQLSIHDYGAKDSYR